MEIISRKDAKRLGQTTYYTGKPCKNGHIAKRWTSSQMCSVCEYGRTVRSRQTHPERRKPAEARYRVKAKDQIRLYNQTYRKTKPHIKCADQAKREARKIQATPSWLASDDIDAMKALYERASVVTRETGISHQVDHIIPLRGKTVSGLHVPWNLQVIPAEENLRKSNHLPERITSRD